MTQTLTKASASLHNSSSEEIRDKFLRSKRRLNISHADYLLILHEADNYCRDYRTILFPGLLQLEQTWCEKQITKWRDILEQIWNNSYCLVKTASGMSAQFKDFEFTKEYLDLISKFKSAPLQQPNDFKFVPVQSNLPISSQPITQPQIIVDTTTVEFLKGKLVEVEKRVKATQFVLQEKNEQFTKMRLTL